MYKSYSYLSHLPRGSEPWDGNKLSYNPNRIWKCFKGFLFFLTILSSSSLKIPSRSIIFWHTVKINRMENKTQSSKYLKGPQKKYNNLHRIGQDCSEQEKKKSALQSAEWLVLHLITRRPQIFFCRPTWQPKVLFIVVVHNLIARVLKHVRWNQTTKIKASLNLAGCCIYKNDLK